MPGNSQKSQRLQNGQKEGYVNQALTETDLPKNGIVLKVPYDDQDASVDKEKDTVPVVVQQENQKSFSARNTLIGCLLGVTASLVISVGQGCIQGVAGGSYYVLYRTFPRLPREKWIWMFICAAFAVGVNLLYGIGVTMIPAGVAACIRRGIDVTTIMVLSHFILKDAITPLKLGCIVGCMTGVVMLIQPWYSASEDVLNSIMSTLSPDNVSIVYETETTISPPGDSGLSEEVTGYIFVALAGMCGSMITFTVKFRLSEMGPFIINLYAGLMGVLVGTPISLATEDIRFPTDSLEIIYITIQTLAWGTASIVGVKAMTLAPAVLITLIFATQIVFLLIGQYTVLSSVQPGVGNWVEITGAVVVLVAVSVEPCWIMKTKLLAQGKEKESANEETFPDSFDLKM